MGVLIRCSTSCACVRTFVVSPPASLARRIISVQAIEKAKDHGPLPQNELALGDVLDSVPGDRGCGKAAWTEKQPSTFVDEGGQPKDGAYDETTPAKRTFSGRKGQVSRRQSLVCLGRAWLMGDV